MTQRSLHWDGASVGDADSLVVNAADGIGWRMSNQDYRSPFIDIMSRALWNGTGNRGVLYGWNNELEVTGATTPISINTGAAIIYGLFYENTTSTTKAIATPTTATRYDHVVVRRSWLARTARITVITGTEGGGIPAITQSPAPTGTGIYDIPLATLEVDTGGNITVTDAREYCAFPTGFADDAFATANIVDDSVDWEHRATRTKRFFLGGGDLQPNVNAGRFSYQGVNYFTQVGPPTWGGGAANEEAWRTTVASSDYRGLYVSFRMPADYIQSYTTPVSTYVWWVNNAVVAATFYIRTAYQTYHDGALGEWAWGYASEYVTTSGAVSDVYRTAGDLLYNVSAGNDADLTTDLIHYYVAFYNTAGTEDISIMGIEVEYQGYT